MSGKRLYKCNYDYFQCIDNPEKAYWLGFLMADGYVSYTKRIRHLKTMDSLQERFVVGLKIGAQDITHLEKYKKAIDSNHQIKVYNTANFNTSTTYGRILIEDKTFYNNLVKLGVSPHKSLIVKYPQIDEKFDLDFIRGYFDGNGCLSCHKSRHDTPEYEFTITSTKEMLETICEKLELNVTDKTFKQRYPERGKNNYTIKYCGNQQTFRVMSLLYDGAEVYLDRKYKKYLELNKYLKESNSDYKI